MILIIGRRDDAQTGDFRSKVQRSFSPIPVHKKRITCSIFLDLRKAYPTINHTILIKKLEKYGIRGLP